MAGIEKQHEFLANLDRFVFLAECYRPEDFAPDVNKALDTIIEYVKNNVELKKSIVESQEWLEESHERIKMIQKKDLLRCFATELNDG